MEWFLRHEQEYKTKPPANARGFIFETEAKPRKGANLCGVSVFKPLSDKDSNLIKYNPKHQVKVGGNMNTTDAGIVGKRLAAAALIFATLTGLAAVIAAAAEWVK